MLLGTSCKSNVTFLEWVVLRVVIVKVKLLLQAQLLFHLALCVA